LIEFLPDAELFADFRFDQEYVDKRLWRYAYLNAGLKIYLDKTCYLSKNGLLDLLDKELGGQGIYDPLYYQDPTLEFAFSHSEGYSDTYYSFVNGTYTSEGGTHLSAFREGVLKGVNEFSNKKFSGNDVRDGIVGTLSVKIVEPVFESQTKNKLGNTDIRAWIVGKVKMLFPVPCIKIQLWQTGFLKKFNEIRRYVRSCKVFVRKLRQRPGKSLSRSRS